MIRFAATFAGAALLFSTGCVHSGPWSVGKALGWKEPKLPAAKKLPPGQLPAATRVEALGQKIIGRQTFPGISPLFFTVGVKDAILFHRGTEELIISEGLVAKCKTEAELAAVLASELGKMIAEKRSARAAGRDVDPIPAPGTEAGPFPGATAVDVSRQAERAPDEKKSPRAAKGADPADAAQVARDLLQDAGFDPAELERVQPLVKQSDRGEKLLKQMGGSAPLPKWEK